MLELNINSETSPLKSVVVGIAEDFGGTPSMKDAYDPKSKEHIKKGTFPDEKSLAIELDGLADLLEKYQVKVFRPNVVSHCNQVFTRDIGFVIDDIFIESNILPNRNREIEGIKYIIKKIPFQEFVKPSMDVRIEGGDVMPWNEYVFVGYSKQKDFDKFTVSRTNEAGVKFIKKQFPDKLIKSFELNKSDDDPYENALHLDCCFQPIGENKCILYPGGFKNQEDVDFLISYFGEENIIKITKQEMYEMYSNIFSIDPETVVSDINFTRLNNELRERGFTVEEIPFSQVAKMEGLLRCSTLPLYRS